MVVYPHKPGSMYILTRNPTVLDALSVPLWRTYLMLFLVRFVEVEFAVRRRSKKNSNANFAKLSCHLISIPPCLLMTSMKKLSSSMEVTPIVLQSLLRRESDGDVFTSLIYLFTMIYEMTLVSPSPIVHISYYRVRFYHQSNDSNCVLVVR